MSKVFLLGANKSIDKSSQVVEVNQIIQMEGYSYDRYVVYDITKDRWGITYKLINLRTKEFYTADIIQPLKEKFGIGYYYDSENPQFMDSFEEAVRRALELVDGKHGFRTHTEIWRDCELTITIGHNIYTTSIVISPPPMALVKRRGNWHNGHAYYCNGVFWANFSGTRVELI